MHPEEHEERHTPRLEVADIQAKALHFLNTPFYKENGGKQYTQEDFFTLLIEHLHSSKTGLKKSSNLDSDKEQEFERVTDGLHNLAEAFRQLAEGKDVLKNLSKVSVAEIFMESALTLIKDLPTLANEELEAQKPFMLQGIFMLSKDIALKYGGILQQTHVSEHSVARPKTTIEPDTADSEPRPSLGAAVNIFLESKVTWEDKTITSANFFKKLCDDLDAQNNIINRILEIHPEKRESLPTSEEITNAKESLMGLLTSMQAIAGSYGKDNYDKPFKAVDIETVKKWLVPFTNYKDISEKVFSVATEYDESIAEDQKTGRQEMINQFIAGMDNFFSPIISLLGSPPSRA